MTYDIVDCSGKNWLYGDHKYFVRRTSWGGRVVEYLIAQGPQAGEWDSHYGITRRGMQFYLHLQRDAEELLRSLREAYEKGE